MELLEIEPELRRHAEPMPKTQGHIRSDRTGSVQDSGNPIGRDAKVACQRRSGQSKLPKFFTEVNARMDGFTSHD